MEIEKLSNDNKGLQFNSYQPRPHAMQDSFQGDNNDYYNQPGRRSSQQQDAYIQQQERVISQNQQDYENYQQ